MRALPQWEIAIRHSGWHPLMMALGYALGATFCWASARAAREDAGGAGVWVAAAALLALMGMDSLARLDLLLVEVLRATARMQGWYEQRHEMQYLLLMMLGVAGLLTLGWVRTRLRGQWARCAPAVLGITLLLALAVLRAVSFHHTDEVLDMRLAGVSAGRVSELAGLCLVCAGALRWLRTR